MPGRRQAGLPVYVSARYTCSSVFAPKESRLITLEVLITTIIWLPLLAAVVLMCYPLALALIRRLPAHEYEQAVRAPAWLAVITGAGLLLLSILALARMPLDGEQVFIGFPSSSPLLMVDAYTLWASALLGAVLAVAAWVPAARRSLVPHSIWPFIVILLLTWTALLMLCGVHLKITLLGWLALLGGVIGLWAFLFRPQGRWHQLEPALVLLLAGILGGSGLLWLLQLAHGDILTNLWSNLLSASPRATNGLVLLLALGWLGPAVYLPWWLWTRRDEQAMVFLPAALLLAVVGPLTLVHVLFLSFPVSGTELTQLVPEAKPLFLVRNVLGWLLAWGLLALLTGAGWLACLVVQYRKAHPGLLRPLVLVSTGLLLLGIAGGLLGQRGNGLLGMLWLQLAWVGSLGIWPAANGLLPALTRNERGERATVLLSCWLALAALVAVPWLPGYRGLAALWGVLSQAAMPPGLIVFALIVTALSAGYLLPRWAATQQADTPHPGVGWGIIAPFAMAFCLVACGLLASQFHTLFALIRQSLLQAF